jgi:hypothetical protein
MVFHSLGSEPSSSAGETLQSLLGKQAGNVSYSTGGRKDPIAPSTRRGMEMSAQPVGQVAQPPAFATQFVQPLTAQPVGQAMQPPDLVGEVAQPVGQVEIEAEVAQPLSSMAQPVQSPMTQPMGQVAQSEGQVAQPPEDENTSSDSSDEEDLPNLTMARGHKRTSPQTQEDAEFEEMFQRMKAVRKAKRLERSLTRGAAN